MPLKTKQSGVYTDLVGIKRKLSGVYGAINAIYGKISGVYTDLDPEVVEPPPPPDPTLYMTLGVNGGFSNTYSGGFMFSNLCLSMGEWQQQTGSGGFTQDQGNLTADTATDTFRAYLADTGDGLPSGTYTVYNPDGCNIAIGNFSSATTYYAWTTDTEFTFSYTSGTGFLGLWAEGSVTNAIGNIAVIMPGHTASYLAGNNWNTEFINFVNGLSPVVWRCMDWNHASENIERDWTDRVSDDGISYMSANQMLTIVPWEMYCDFANRAGVDIWINVPTRATDAYITSLAQLIAAQLDADRKVYLEYGNEIWNTAAPWGDGTKWVEYLDHTRYTFTADPATDELTFTGHGFSENEPVIGFATKENMGADITVNWQTRYGSTSYVHVVDADTIQLMETAGGATIDIVAGQVNVMLSRTTEASRVANQDEHYAERSMVVWDTFSSILGPTRIERVCASQAAGSSHTSGRLAVAGMTAKTDHVAIAIYINGNWFAGRLTPDSGQVTPGFWGNMAHTVHCGIYAEGSTPTVQQILDGAGTGFVAKTSWSYTATNGFSDTSAITGLVDTTTYTAWFVAIAADGYEWEFSADFTVTGSSPVTVYAFDSDTHQAQRLRMGYINSSTIATHQALAGDIPVIMYEGGPDFNKTQPDEVEAHMQDFLETTQCRDSIKHYLYTIAAKGCKLFNYYGDIIGLFSLADSYSDTPDLRYTQYAALSGQVAIRDLPSVIDQTPSHLSEPGAFPATVHTISEPDLTYTIVSGDLNGNYTFDGAALKIANDTGINWAGTDVHTLLVEATDGFTSCLLTVTFSVGVEPWYATDASFAWSTITDSDSAAINPVLGNEITLTSGNQASVASGLWDMNGGGTQANYSNNTALTAGISMDNPFLFAFVIERDDHTTEYTSIVALSTGSRFIRATWDNDTPTERFRVRVYNNGIWDFKLVFDDLEIPATKTVCWVFYDGAGNWSCGENQTTTDTHIQNAAGYSLGQHLSISGSSCKHGSIQVVGRAGMTLAEAKAIVQDMQDHHSIA